MPNGSPYEPSPEGGPLRQAELLSDVPQFLLPINDLLDVNVEGTTVAHRFVAIVSQDCDLDWDYRARFPGKDDRPVKSKDLPSVLLCETREVEGGVRLTDFDGDVWKRIRQNQDERYHVLAPVPPELDRLGVGIPMLLLDFKRYFTLPTAEIYARLGLDPATVETVHRRTLVESPWREDLSARFANFLSRVALPEAMSRSTQ